MKQELNYTIEYADNGVIIRDTDCPWTEVVPFGEEDSTTPCSNAFGRLIFEDIGRAMQTQEELEEITIHLKIKWDDK